jgi:tellurite resistance protein TehA-like permease
VPAVSARPRSLDRVLSLVPPAAGAAVMGNGAVSTALILDGRDALADALLWIGAAMWAGLALLLVAAALFDRKRLRAEGEQVAALSWPAGTFVLGTHFTLYGWPGVGAALLAVGALFWAAMTLPDLRRIPRGAAGAAFLGASATFTFSVLAAVLGRSEGVRWLPIVALALLVCGLVLYGFVLLRFDFGQLLRGHGDHWVPGGALATAAFASGELRRASLDLDLLGGFDVPLEVLDLGLWHLAIVWLPVLVGCELARPRPGFDARRWGTVYALGVFTASSLAVGSVEGIDWIDDLGGVLVWAALACWALVLGATVRRIAGLGSPPGPRV